MMKKTFYIESNSIYKDGKVYYYPVPQNAKWFYNLWQKHSLECIGMRQWSDQCWEVRLKGKKKDIQQFVCKFTIELSEEYSIRETSWVW